MSLTTVIPNGDGTGTQVTYGDDGTITARVPVGGLCVADPAPPVADPVAALVGIVAALDAIGPTTTSAQVRTALIAARNNAAQAIPT